MGCVFRNRFWLREQLFQGEENGQDKTVSLNSGGKGKKSQKTHTRKPPCSFCGFCHCCWENTVPSQGMNFFQLGGNWDLPRATLNQSFKVCPIYLSPKEMLFRSVLWMTTRRVFNISNPGFLGGEKLCDVCSLAMLLLHSTCWPSSAFSNFLSSVHKQMSYPLFFLTLCSHFTQIAVPTSEQCPFPLPCLCLMGDFRCPWKWTSQSSTPTPPLELQE